MMQLHLILALLSNVTLNKLKRFCSHFYPDECHKKDLVLKVEVVVSTGLKTCHKYFV